MLKSRRAFFIASIVCVVAIVTLVAIQNFVQASVLKNTTRYHFPPNTWGYALKPSPHTILHWTENSYIPAGGIDPADGQVITYDRWVMIGADGTPTLVHYRVTLPDGTLYQEEYLTPSQRIAVSGPAYAKVLHIDTAASPQWCLLSQSLPAPSSPDAQARRESIFTAYLPVYVDEQKMIAAGFTSTTTYGRPFPNTTVIAVTNPATVITWPSTITHSWHIATQDPDTHGTTEMFHDIAAGGRLLAAGFTIHDPGNPVFIGQWQTQGTLLIYSDTTTIPEWVTSLPEAVTKGCAA